MKINGRHGRNAKSISRQDSPDEIRARFEKEAHDRVQKELDSLRNNYELWIANNRIRNN